MSDTPDFLVKREPTPPRVLISALVFGIIFSVLFTNQGFGLNLTIFFFLVYLFAVLNRSTIIRKTFRQEPLMYLFSIPVLFLSVTFLTSQTALRYVSLLVMLFVMFVQYIVLSGNALNRWDEGGFLIDLLFGAINRVLFGITRFVADGCRALFGKKTGVLAGVGVGVALLLIVVPLMVLADANLSVMLDRFLGSVPIGDIFLYLVMFLIGASLITAPASTARAPESTGARSAPGKLGRPVPPVTVAVALSMVSVAYVLFACLQFSYFFLPRGTIATVLGLTRSAYAVRGFGELLVITCLNFVLVLCGLRFTRQKNGATQPGLKLLYTLLIAVNFVMLASAHLRMQCYEEAFGYSVARLLAHSFMVFLAVLNVLMLIRIYWQRVKIVRLFATAALVYLCIVVAVNPESTVAATNIARYEQTGNIDTEYLFTLEGDALVQACDFVEEHPETFSQAAQDIAQSRLMTSQPESWASLNLARQRAHRRLAELLKKRR